MNKKVGTYYLGNDPVDLYVRRGTGAEFYYFYKELSNHRIVIGIDWKWDKVVSALLHETFEMTSDKLRVRYTPQNNYSNSSGDFLFSFDHLVFSEICAICGEFVSRTLPDIAKIHKNHKF